MHVLLIGAPGSGKGTQGPPLAEHFGVPCISSGDLLRDHMVRGTPEGLQAADFVDHGDLVPGALVQEMLRDPIRKACTQGGYILDGFPRTLPQAVHVMLDPLTSAFVVQAAVHLMVPTEELVRRVLARNRGADDSPSVIGHRLAVFEEHTTPMLEFFSRRGELITVNGGRPVEEVTASILVQLTRVQQQIGRG